MGCPSRGDSVLSSEKQMIELGEELRQLIALGHIRGDFLAAGVIVYMSVGVDDVHGSFTSREKTLL